MGIAADNLKKIRSEIASAVEKSGRPADSVQLLAVSKFHPAEAVIDAVEAGQRLFGENRVQEAVQKFPAILAQYPDVQLHLIGSLQRNKVKAIIPYASCIQSVDRYELAEEIIKQRRKYLTSGEYPQMPDQLSLLFEVHTGEESKSGFTSEDDLCKTLELCSQAQDAGIVCNGFMTMAPNTTDTAAVRESFRKLSQIRQRMQQQFPDLPLTELSMGMSGDFPIAVEEGSTMVRIGTAIFGERSYD